jgi:adenosylhomocysteine nucleosidase
MSADLSNASESESRHAVVKRIAVFTATRWELNAVRRAIPNTMRRLSDYHGFAGRWGSCEVMLIRTGVGMVKGRKACRAFLSDHALDLVVSSGFACALNGSGIGDVLIGTDVMVGETQKSAGVGGSTGKLHCAGHAIEAAMQAARDTGRPAPAGPFVTVPRVLWRAEEKHRMAAETGAIGLDMESAAVGASAAERNVPFVVIRTVSDLLDEDLPVDFNLFLHPADWPKGTWACLARPSLLMGLNRLRVQAAVASDRLTVFFRRFFDGFHE